MANPPYSGSVIIIRENADGLAFDLFHWADVPEDMSIPPAGPLSAKNMVGRSLEGTSPQVVTKRNSRMCTTRAEAKTKFGQFLDQNFPDTPA